MARRFWKLGAKTGWVLVLIPSLVDGIMILERCSWLHLITILDQRLARPPECLLGDNQELDDHIPSLKRGT